MKWHQKIILAYMIGKPPSWDFWPTKMGEDLGVGSRTMSQYLNDLSKLEVIERDEKHKWRVSENLIEKLRVLAVD